MLAGLASGDSGKAWACSNLGSVLGSYVEGGIGSFAGSEVSENLASLSSTVWGAIGGIAK